MKNLRTIILTIIVIALLLCSCSAGGGSPVDVDDAMNKAVSSAILKKNSGTYLEGELKAEAHIIYGAESEGDNIKVYCSASYSEYAFENGNFVSIAGSGVPVVITFDKNYNLVDYQMPSDGSEYAPSLKKLFPSRYRARIDDFTDEDRADIDNQFATQVKAYLEKIGRQDAKFGDFSDFSDQYKYIDYFVGDNASNAVTEMYEVGGYPNWIGSREVLKGNERYVYTTDYDSVENKIIYTQYLYDTPDDIIEKTSVDVTTGAVKQLI